MNFNPRRKRPADSGFTLVEVLVALVVLSIGLLGLAALQLSSLQFNTNSLFRTQATVAAYDIIDRMRSNRTGFKANAYQVPNASDAANVLSTYGTCSLSSGSCNCKNATNPCAPADLAIYDLGNWYLQTDSLLPGSSSNRATIVRDATTNEVTITINWTEKDVSQSKVWKVRL